MSGIFGDLATKLLGSSTYSSDFKTGKTTVTNQPGAIQNLATKLFSPKLISPVSSSNFSQNISTPKKSTPLPSPTPSPAPSQAPTQFGGGLTMDDFVKIATPIFQSHGIPLSVGFGQFAGEGRLSGMGAKRNNFFNIAAYDSNPNAAVHYPTPQAGIEAYSKLISSDKRYSGAYAARNDPKKMIDLIHKAGYASRPDYANFIINTPEFQKYLQ